MSKHLYQVPQILVNTGNQSILGAGNAVADLAVGQFGVFNKNGLSRSSGTAVAGEEYFIATKLADGTVVRSGILSTANTRNIVVQCAVANVQQVVDITNICADCSSDYAVRVDINHPAAWHTYGYQPYLKTFVARTACCNADGTASCTELVRDLRDEINADPEGLLTATARNPAGLAELNDAALDAWDEVADGCPVLRIAVNAISEPNFNSIPYKHIYPELATITVTTSGFSCCSPATAVANSTNPVVGQGDGSFVKYEEYQFASSMGQGRYPQTQSGVVLDRQYNADVTTTYSSVTFEYDDPAAGSFTTYDDPQILRLWIPTAAANTEDNLGDIIDALTAGYGIDTALTACD